MAPRRVRVTSPIIYRASNSTSRGIHQLIQLSLSLSDIKNIIIVSDWATYIQRDTDLIHRWTPKQGERAEDQNHITRLKHPRSLSKVWQPKLQHWICTKSLTHSRGLLLPELSMTRRQRHRKGMATSTLPPPAKRNEFMIFSTTTTSQCISMNEKFRSH